MYLSMLNETEKILFLDAACRLASIDGNFDDYEQSIIADYCQEMQISYTLPSMEQNTEVFLEDMANTLTASSKKIVLFELIKLAISDGNYDDSERTFLWDMASALGLSVSYADQCEEVITEYLYIRDKINTTVLL